MLQLDEDGDYYVDEHGTRYVRVTRVLQQSGCTRDYSRADPFYKDRGRAVHFALDLLRQDRLDWSSLDDNVRPFVSAYKKFLEVSGYKPLYWERMVASAHGFAGTIDDIGELNGKLVLIDEKTGESVDRAVELQTGAYEIAWQENQPERTIAERYYLQLRENGTFSLKSVSQTPPWAFLAVYYQWRWQQKMPLPAVLPAKLAVFGTVSNPPRLIAQQLMNF